MILKAYALAGLLWMTALLPGNSSAAEGQSRYDAAFQAGQNLQKIGKFAEARVEFEKALAAESITTEQTGQAWVQIGAGYIQEKKVQDGIAALQKARALKGVSNQILIEANLLFGQTYLAYPWVLDQSRDAFAKILTLPELTADKKTAAQRGLVQALMGLKQFADARAVMIDLAANTNVPPAERVARQMAIGNTFMLEGKHPEVRAEFGKALLMEGLAQPDKVDIQLQIGLSYYGEKDFGHAKAELQKVLTMPGADDMQTRNEGWGNYSPSREANLRLIKMQPTDEKRNTIAVCFIGSSMTTRGYMPHVVEAVAASAPAGRPRIITGKYTRGGTKIDVFWNDGDTRDTARGLIAALPWDAVVLETFYTMKPEELLKYGKLFGDLARSKNIKLVLYESQPAQAVAYPESYRKFHDDNVALGKTLQIPVAAVVLAEMLYVEGNPTAKIGSFYDDWIHPSEKGIYLAAYCIYSAITGFSPVGLAHPSSISEEDAKALQEAAWKAVQETNPGLKPWVPASSGEGR